MNWIKIKDRLPEKNTPVLVYDGGIEVCELGKAQDGEYYFWDRNGVHVYKPTHWTPLPEKPKK